MKHRSAVVFGLLVGCGGRISPSPSTDSNPSTPDGSTSASGADASTLTAALPDPCPGSPDLPPTLECTGLYSNFATKQVADAARSFAPAVQLWSDGASKRRWVYLPPGTIDNSSPSEWVFPVGTRFWKEFSVGGKRIETRLFKKVHAGYWVHATYEWNSDDSAALLFAGGDVPVAGGGTWHIPIPSECDKCHNGRSERVLGFEQGLLGLPGATGISLVQLVAEGRLSSPPAQTMLQLGDDGTGLAILPLGWLHVNCGVTCHNTNQGSLAYGAGMNLRLDPLLLDGRSSAGFASLLTTIGVPAQTPSWNGAIRIVPSDPAVSLLVQLISHRGMGIQMPPIATNVVDAADVARVVAWVTSMAPLPALADAGAVDGGSGMDATMIAVDAGAVDSSVADANGAAIDTDAGDSGTVEAAAPPDAADEAAAPEAGAPDALE